MESWNGATDVRRGLWWWPTSATRVSVGSDKYAWTSSYGLRPEVKAALRWWPSNGPFHISGLCFRTTSENAKWWPPLTPRGHSAEMRLLPMGYGLSSGISLRERKNLLVWLKKNHGIRVWIFQKMQSLTLKLLLWFATNKNKCIRKSRHLNLWKIEQMYFGSIHRM